MSTTRRRTITPLRMLAALSPYGRIMRIPGALGFSAAGLVARVPIATASIGLVLYASARTGSYGIAGQLAGAYVLGTALCAPAQARLVDRHGQARVLPVLALAYGTFLGSVPAAIELGAPVAVSLPLAALAGASAPMAGSYVRARWSHLLAGSPRLATAFAFESMVDEMLFMVGTPLVTVLATMVAPWAGVVTALVTGTLGALALGAQRSTQPPPHPRRRGGPAAEPLGWRLLIPVAAAGVGVGGLLGSTEIVVVALASEQGARAVSGPLLGLWACGSLLSALIVGALPPKRSSLARFRWGTVGLALAAAPLPFIDQLGVLAVFLFLAGFAISPTMIARVGVVQESVPSSRLSEGMAWATSTMVAGLAAGSPIAGLVVDHAGASAGFAVPLLAGLFAVVVAWLTGRRSTVAGAAASGGPPSADEGCAPDRDQSSS